MNTVKMKFLKDTDLVKKGEILDVSTKGDHHLAYVKCGIAKIIEENRDKKHLDELRKQQEARKTDEDKEIEHIMNEKQCDFEIAVRLYNDREERKKVQEIRKKQTKKKTIAEQEKETFQNIIKKMESKSFFVDTIKEINKEVEGEEDTIAAEIIVATTRLVNQRIPESINLLLSDKTGLGKDWTTKKTLEVIIPEEDLCHVTKMTPESFTYWHYGEDDWTWDNKVIHFEDITQNLLNCSTFKTMASGDNHAIVVKDQKTLEIPINGKPVMILTSHHANPKDEALRRFRIGGLNDTKKQTRKILNKISKSYTGVHKKEIDYVLRSAVQSLEPCDVIIPYAEIIQHFFPDNDIMRTHYRCFLDYIAGSAVFHQKQRERTENKEIIATPDDYMIARMVLIYTTSNPKMIPLSKEYRDILKILQDNDNLTVKELEPKCSFSLPWLYKHLPNLVTTGLVEKGSKYNEQANKDVTTYKFADFSAKMIPTWEELSNQIYDIVYKTNKTNKTEAAQQLEKWFSTVDIKPIKPNCKKEEFFLVLYGRIIPLNREVLLVFSVFYAFLRERDEERYKKYYENHQPTEEKEIQSTLNTIDQKEDLKRFYDFSKTLPVFSDGRKNKEIMKIKLFKWDDQVNDFIKDSLGKENPNNWIKHNIDKNILSEPMDGYLRFLIDFGGE